MCDGPESGSDEKYNFVLSTNSLDTDSTDEVRVVELVAIAVVVAVVQAVVVLQL